MYFNRNKSLLYSAILCLSITHCKVFAMPASTNGNDTTHFFHINLEPWLDNKAFGENADFDNFGSSFSGQLRSSNDILIDYQMGYKNNDNIKANSQQISIPNVPLGALYILASVTHGPYTTPLKVKYADGSEDITTLSIPDWQDEQVNQMERYQFIQLPTTIDGRQGALFSIPIYINPSKVPKNIVLPNHENEYETAHIFAITAYGSGDVILTSIQSTDEWINNNDQVVAVRIHNTSPVFIKNVQVNLKSESLLTVKQGFLEALAPGHTHMLQVIVRKVEQQKPEDTVVTMIYTKNGVTHTKEKNASLTLLATHDQYQATTMSVQKHRSPTWLKQSKFGIFIHWGLFSVPSWAPVGKAYAEWYWWRMNHKDDDAFKYHREHYGENFNYDDFLTQWNPTEFNPQNWLDLIDKSRAKYWVFTTKHHDGIALFDTNVTERSTMHLLQPNRDFVKELVNVSRSAYPHLKRGLYFSLPEWYHPKYDDESLGWHGPPKNPYTGQRIAYRGGKTINSFVNELQVPQFQELANNYEPDLLWCDIGGINNSTVWQSEYFNYALKNGRQVAVNDRCGDGSASDFTTIEYKAVTDTPTRFWEATRGIDPYSFGFNRETKPEEYASTKELIENLVDAISKGGNFLLNIGPEASGQIPQPMSQRLLEIGQWIDRVNASVFDSVPYWITSNQEEIRITANSNGKSIYIFYVASEYNNVIEINVPIPMQKESIVRLMNQPDKKVEWRYNKMGNIELIFDVSPQDLQTMHIPVFELVTPI